METIKSAITFNGMKDSRTLHTLVKHHVEKWIKRERALLFLPNHSSYSVHVDKEGDGYFNCHVEIRIGAREWTGLEDGRSVIDAISKTLKHLRPKHLRELYRSQAAPVSHRQLLSEMSA